MYDCLCVFMCILSWAAPSPGTSQVLHQREGPLSPLSLPASDSRCPGVDVPGACRVISHKCLTGVGTRSAWRPASGYEEALHDRLDTNITPHDWLDVRTLS